METGHTVKARRGVGGGSGISVEPGSLRCQDATAAMQRTHLAHCAAHSDCSTSPSLPRYGELTRNSSSLIRSTLHSASGRQALARRVGPFEYRIVPALRSIRT